MSEAEPIQCAICGWTGRAGDLEEGAGEPSCPACGEAVPRVE